jgi:uncharacterized protein (DUF433 family)
VSRRRIGARDIVFGFKSGMTRDELMEKYQLSSRQLDHVLKETLKAGRNLAKKVADDVRAGVTDSQLMEKYRLTLDGLHRAFKMLLDGGFIDKGAYHSRLPKANQAPFLIEKRQGVFPVFR